MNPQLHYLDHIQNTSISKYTSQFAKAPRFQPNKTTNTQFSYHPRPSFHTRSCNFGYGKRSSFGNSLVAPGPNKYDTRRSPSTGIAHRMGLSRDQAIFGTIQVQIKRKAANPSPSAYKIQGSIKNKRFTLRKRLNTQNNMPRSPGPGQYEAIQINQRGQYPTSNCKNARTILLDTLKKQPQSLKEQPGPGAYDHFNLTSFKKRPYMHYKCASSFGTSVRKGPQNQQCLKVPGPGQYDFFSPFGERVAAKSVKTQY